MIDTNRSQATPSTRAFYIGLILFPIVLFYAVSWRYSLNIPWFDDIENIPFFLNNFIKAEGFGEKIAAIFRPGNEHRIVSSRLVILFNHFLTHQLNFKLITLIGNLTVLGIFALITKAYLKQGRKIIVLLTITFFIFSLQFYSMTQMAIMSLQYQLIIFEVFLSFYLLSKNTSTAFIWAVLVALLSTCSMGNGMLVWPIGAVMLAYQVRWKQLFIWCLVGVLAITAYFWGQNIVQGNDKGFEYVRTHLLDVIIGFFVFIGGTVDWFPQLLFKKRMVLPGLFGFTLFCFFIFWTIGIIAVSPNWKKIIPTRFQRFYDKQKYFNTLDTSIVAFWLGCFLFLLLTAAMVVFFRTRFNYWLILWATYKIYPATLIAICTLLIGQILNIKWQNKFGTFALVLALLSWFFSYWYFIPEMSHTRKQRMAYAFNQKYDGIGLGASRGSTVFIDFVIKTLNDASQNGTYSIPNPIIHKEESLLAATMRDSTKVLPLLDVEIIKRDYDVLAVNNSLDFKTNYEDGAYILAWSDKNFYIFDAPPNGLYWRPSKGFSSPCSTGSMEIDEYKIGVWVLAEGQSKLYKTKTKFKVE